MRHLPFVLPAQNSGLLLCTGDGEPEFLILIDAKWIRGPIADLAGYLEEQIR